MNLGFHHYKRKKVTSKGYPYNSIVNKLVYLAALLGPISIAPQLIKIFADKTAAGVSPITWAGYFFGAFFWTAYGVVHKDKPIILMNISVGILALAILVGIYLYQ